MSDFSVLLVVCPEVISFHTSLLNIRVSYSECLLAVPNMVCMQLKSGTPKISCFSNSKSSNNHILKRGLIAKLNRKSMLIPRMKHEEARFSLMRAFLDRQNFLPQHGTAGALERCGAQLLACKILFTSQHQLNRQAI